MCRITWPGSRRRRAPPRSRRPGHSPAARCRPGRGRSPSRRSPAVLGSAAARRPGRAGASQIAATPVMATRLAGVRLALALMCDDPPRRRSASGGSIRRACAPVTNAGRGSGRDPSCGSVKMTARRTMFRRMRFPVSCLALLIGALLALQPRRAAGATRAGRRHLPVRRAGQFGAPLLRQRLARTCADDRGGRPALGRAQRLHPRAGGLRGLHRGAALRRGHALHPQRGRPAGVLAGSVARLRLRRGRGPTR